MTAYVSIAIHFSYVFKKNNKQLQGRRNLLLILNKWEDLKQTVFWKSKLKSQVIFSSILKETTSS